MTASSSGDSATVLLTPRMIGEINRSRVIQSLCDHGPTTRADLARLANVPRATIGAICQGLLDDGLIEEQAAVHLAGQVGKPGIPLWFRERSALSICVAFEPRRINAALINARGDVLEQQSHDLDTMSAALPELVGAIRSLIAALWTDDGILGVGIAVPGIVGPTGRVFGSRLVPGSVGTGLVTQLGEGLDVPVIIDSDAQIRALGEKWFGDGRGVSTFAAVQTGVGLGVGLVLRHTLFRGEDGLGGYLAHTCVDPLGEPCACGLRGCWQTVATLPWVRRRASEVGLPGAEQLDAAALVALTRDPVHAGDARELLWAYADNLARGLSTLVLLMGTRCLLMHGDVVGGGEELRTLIERATRERCMPEMRDYVTVALSQHAAEASLLGAAGRVLSATFALDV